MSCEDKHIVDNVLKVADEPLESLEKIQNCLTECSDGSCTIESNEQAWTKDKFGRGLLFMFSNWCENHNVDPDTILDVTKTIAETRQKVPRNRLEQVLLTLIDKWAKANVVSTASQLLLEGLPEFHIKDTSTIVDTFLKQRSKIMGSKTIVFVTGFSKSGKSTYIKKHLNRFPLIEAKRTFTMCCYDTLEESKTPIIEQLEEFLNEDKLDTLRIIFRLAPNRLHKSISNLRKWASGGKKRGSIWEIYQNNPLMKHWCNVIFTKHKLYHKFIQTLRFQIHRSLLRNKRLTIEIDQLNSLANLKLDPTITIKHIHILRKAQFTTSEIVDLCSIKEKLLQKQRVSISELGSQAHQFKVVLN